MIRNAIIEFPSERSLQFEYLGAISHFLAHHPKLASLQFAALAAWIEPAVTLKQARVFFDGAGEVVGFVTWAHFSTTVEQLWYQSGPCLLRFSDWNEEGRLWIAAFSVLPEYLRSIITNMRREDPFCQESTISWVRIRPRDGVRKCFSVRVYPQGRR